MIDQDVTGAIFPVGDDKLFKAYLSELMRKADQLSEMETVCQAKVRKEFSIEKEVTGNNAVYETVWGCE